VGLNEVILERALLRFIEAAVRFTPMVAVLGLLDGFRSSRGVRRAAHGLHFSEIRRSRLIIERNVIHGKHFLTLDDICHVYHLRNLYLDGL
jgi:hypothetical protein